MRRNWIVTYKYYPHESINVGDMVKISLRVQKHPPIIESFWVAITNKSYRHLHGTVDNQLLLSDFHHFQQGDIITFRARHIMSIWLST